MSQERQLHERRAAYQSLSNHLVQLPRKLTQPGLIPIAPRLYLPGQLVRTNEILVLLGRSGEASYFAERTAWQAHQIVRRRLGYVEQGLREVLSGVGDVTVSDRLPSKPKKHVTFREPVVCASPPVKSRPRNPNIPSDPSWPCYHSPSSISPPDTLLLSSSPVPAPTHTSANHPTTPQSIPSMPQQYIDVLRAAEWDEDSSDDDINDYANNQEDDFTQFISQSDIPYQPSRDPETSRQAPPPHASKLVGSKSQSIRTVATAQLESQSDKKESQLEPSHQTERQSIQTEFHQALQSAQKQAVEESVVNIVEFYDGEHEGESEAPSSVDMSPHFTPNSNIDFDNDDEEYLDMTGVSADASGNESLVPENHLEFLRQEAQKEQVDERRKESEKAKAKSDRRRSKLEQEKEFGTGFARGFFSSQPPRENARKKTQSGNSCPAPQVQSPEVSGLQRTGAQETEGAQETAALQESVVERKIVRKSSRKHRKSRATASPDILSVAGSQTEREIGEAEKSGHFTEIEDDFHNDATPISKFRQLREQQKINADVSSKR